MNILVGGPGNALMAYKEVLRDEKILIFTEVGPMEEVLSYALSEIYDALVLYFNAYGNLCFSLIAELRQQNFRGPILALALPESLTLENILMLLNTGCNDVIYTAMDPREFLGRLRAHTRHHYGLKDPLVVVGNMRVDLNAHHVFVEERLVDLTPKEQILLECLAVHKNHILSKEHLLARLYGGRDEPEIRIIDAFIWRIRKKLNEAGQNEDYVQTIWGRGYRLSELKDLN